MTQESLWLLSNKTCTILNDAREASLSVAESSSESMDKHGGVHQTELTLLQADKWNKFERPYLLHYLCVIIFQTVSQYIIYILVCTVVGYINSRIPQ